MKITMIILGFLSLVIIFGALAVLKRETKYSLAIGVTLLVVGGAMLLIACLIRVYMFWTALGW